MVDHLLIIKQLFVCLNLLVVFNQIKIRLHNHFRFCDPTLCDSDPDGHHPGSEEKVYSGQTCLLF